MKVIHAEDYVYQGVESRDGLQFHVFKSRIGGRHRHTEILFERCAKYISRDGKAETFHDDDYKRQKKVVAI